MHRAAVILGALITAACAGVNTSRVYVAQECYAHFPTFESELNRALKGSCDAGHQCATQHMGQSEQYVRVTCPEKPRRCAGELKNVLACYRVDDDTIEIYRYRPDGDMIRFVRPEDGCYRSRGWFDINGNNLLAHEFGHAQGYAHSDAKRIPVMRLGPDCHEDFSWTP